jgi:CBS domain-containing protein
MFERPVKEIMNKYPITIKKSTTIAKASELLLNYKINGVIVLEEDNETLYGVVTTTDLLNLMLKVYKESGDQQENYKKVAGNPVSEITTKSVLKLQTESTMKEAMDLVEKNGIHTIPIYNEIDKLIGVIGRHDFLNYVYKT